MIFFSGGSMIWKLDFQVETFLARNVSLTSGAKTGITPILACNNGKWNLWKFIRFDGVMRHVFLWPLCCSGWKQQNKSSKRAHGELRIKRRVQHHTLALFGTVHFFLNKRSAGFWPVKIFGRCYIVFNAWHPLPWVHPFSSWQAVAIHLSWSWVRQGLRPSSAVTSTGRASSPHPSKLTSPPVRSAIRHLHSAFLLHVDAWKSCPIVTKKGLQWKKY